MTAGEIANHFAMSKPSISHHLSILKQARLVQDLRQGQNIYYSLNTTVFQEAIGWFLEMLDQTEKSQVYRERITEADNQLQTKKITTRKERNREWK